MRDSSLLAPNTPWTAVWSSGSVTCRRKDPPLEISGAAVSRGNAGKKGKRRNVAVSLQADNLLSAQQDDALGRARGAAIKSRPDIGFPETGLAVRDSLLAPATHSHARIAMSSTMPRFRSILGLFALTTLPMAC